MTLTGAHAAYTGYGATKPCCAAHWIDFCNFFEKKLRKKL